MRIDKAVLLMPCSVALGPVFGMLADVLLPTLQYQLRPSRGPLQRLLERMSDSVEVDELALETVGAVFRHVKLEHGFPRTADWADLACFTAPVLAFAGKRDCFFPADRVLPCLRDRLPNLVAAKPWRAVTSCGRRRWPPFCPASRRSSSRGRRLLGHEAHRCVTLAVTQPGERPTLHAAPLRLLAAMDGAVDFTPISGSFRVLRQVLHGKS